MIRTIETLAVALYCASCFVLLVNYGLASATVAAGLGITLYALLYGWIQRYKRRELLAHKAMQVDNSYIKSESAHDRSVRDRARKEAQLLLRSGNKEFSKGNLKVHALFFRPSKTLEELVRIDSSSRHVVGHLVFCEHYDRFLELTEDYREEVEAQHHKKIAGEDGPWYLDNALNQD